jgi:hypothetical protein
MAALAQAAAKRNFLTVCRRAIQDGKRVYVADKAGKSYLTLDPDRRHLSGPVLDLSAQFFKDNFARCSSLVKDGLCFRLTLRGINQSIYARRHTKYTDACDAVIENWQSQVAGQALVQQQEAELMAVFRRFEHRSDTKHEEVLAAFSKLTLGIARLAIGHRPFEEGQLPSDA